MKTKMIIGLTGLIMALLFASLSLYSQSWVTNPDKPAHGKWDFKPVKLWEIDEVAGDVFADIGNITADENGTVYAADWKNFKVFILDKNGTFISSFGKKGEGPGEMKRLGRFFLVNGKIAFPDRGANRVHYFSKRGKYMKSIIMPATLTPRGMIDENRLISVPYINWRDPKGKAEGFIYNIKDKSKKTIFQFASYRKGMVHKSSGGSSYSFSYSNSAITPGMVISYSGGKIYYGKN